MYINEKRSEYVYEVIDVYVSSLAVVHPKLGEGEQEAVREVEEAGSDEGELPL